MKGETMRTNALKTGTFPLGYVPAKCLTLEEFRALGATRTPKKKSPAPRKRRNGGTYAGATAASERALVPTVVMGTF